MGMENRNKTGRQLIMAACLLALVLMVSGCAAPPPLPPAPEGIDQAVIPTTRPPALPSDCKTKECFAADANDCKEKSILVNEDFGTVAYSAKGCVFTKTIVSLDASEPQDMKLALEGKSLTCKYEKGNFNEEWTGSLVLGIDNCEGNLRDALALLTAFAQ